MLIITLLQTLIIVATAPLLLGVVKWLKCQLQNRQSPSILQPYRNLNKLLRKDMHVATTASFIFRATPYIVFGIMVVVSALVPLLVVGNLMVDGASASGVSLSSSPLALNFAVLNADIIVLVGLFALARFFLALAGMDVGTAFGGMGSAREMMISSIAEPALLMALFTLAMIASSTNIPDIMIYLSTHQFFLHPALIFAAVGFALVAVAETGRIPVDNPATHLELTMVHEAMILEYSGRHLALLEWAGQIKFMIYCLLFVNFFLPWGNYVDAVVAGMPLRAVAAIIVLNALTLILKMLALCIVLVIAENHLAKLRLFRVPWLLNCAFLLCLLGALSDMIL